MASGHPDYWYSFFPGLPSLGAGQTSWYAAHEIYCAADASTILFNYNVPVDYILNLFGGGISCEAPGINGINIKGAGETFWNLHFDTYQALLINSASCFIINGEDLLQVIIENNDTVQAYFRVVLFGYLKHIKT